MSDVYPIGTADQAFAARHRGKTQGKKESASLGTTASSKSMASSPTASRFSGTRSNEFAAAQYPDRKEQHDPRGHERAVCLRQHQNHNGSDRCSDGVFDQCLLLA